MTVAAEDQTNNRSHFYFLSAITAGFTSAVCLMHFSDNNSNNHVESLNDLITIRLKEAEQVNCDSEYNTCAIRKTVKCQILKHVSPLNHSSLKGFTFFLFA
ncbi:hypothetical protein XENORESO_021366 [Xenotaenia resolanae]|uniref:Uncharacterized protein n=1 Tax=Xenotaenia resolanae TaxID=208358 RepID=A0ABV0X7H3_9TELE